MIKQKTNFLGNTGVPISKIVYGTSYLGNLYKELNEEEKLALMQEWFKVSRKYVTIDSAGKYGAGLALETIGKGLEKLGVEPQQITISNKLGWFRIPLNTKEPTFEPGAWVNLKYDAVQKISYNGILECWKQGCELLGKKYKAQLVSVHDPDEYLLVAENENERKRRWLDVLDAYIALFELKQKGEVKAVGIGSKDWITIQMLYQEVKFDWVMFANKFTIYHHPKEIIEFMTQLQKDGVGIINSAVFNAGFLTGGDYFDYRYIEKDNPENKPLFAWRERFHSICKEFEIPPGDACLNFGISAPQISAVALNPGKVSRMKRNVEIVEKEFPKEFWDALKESEIIDSQYPYL